LTKTTNAAAMIAASDPTERRVVSHSPTATAADKARAALIVPDDSTSTPRTVSLSLCC
jgi:hypothetical protein